MATRWERYLERWQAAGLIDDATVERIRSHEAAQDKVLGLSWPVLVAISLGGLLLGAGVLLFVAAHWDSLAPADRFALVLALVASFHLAGALAGDRFAVLATTLHAVGTISLGAGIFLAGQIFNLEEHWPSGVMLWALGGWVAWVLLRDWPQAALVALLTPMWLTGEWAEATLRWSGGAQFLVQGMLLLAITYLTGLLPDAQTPVRKVLMWIGGLALIPCTFLVILVGSPGFIGQVTPPLPERYYLMGWMGELVLPLALAWVLRRRAVWINFIAAVWVIVLGTTGPRLNGAASLAYSLWHELGAYAMCALGAIGLIAWGLKEASKERINLGVAGFALTVFVFYFSNVMDKLGRSASLIGLGVLFLLGGWALEKVRRRLVARLEPSEA